MKKFLRSPAVYVLFALVALLLISSLFRGGSSAEKLSLSELETQVKAGNVKTAVLTDPDSVKGELKKAIEGKTTLKYESKYPAQFADELTQQLQVANPPVDIQSKPKKENVWLSYLLSFLPFVLLIGIFFFLINSMQGGGSKVMQFGKARAKQVSKDQPKVTFSDVAGADEAV